MKFLSQVYTGASGSIGGVTYSRNRGGMYTRARAIPTNPNTIQQGVVRSIFGQLATAWVNTLTATQRAGWALYGTNVPRTNPLGAQILLTGLQWFQAMNTPRIQAGLAVVATAPTTFTMCELTAPTADPPDAAADTVDINFTGGDDWAAEVGGALFVYASRPQNTSIEFFKGPYRYAGSVLGAVVAPTPPATINLPFPVAAGNRVFFKFLAVRADGRISEVVRDRATAV